MCHQHHAEVTPNATSEMVQDAFSSSSVFVSVSLRERFRCAMYLSWEIFLGKSVHNEQSHHSETSV